MSYSLTEFHCDPHMNLIIGPNGSGKSTFVCAVCIGLGGKISFLGKENMTVDQFIKEDEKTGYIELELKASDNDFANGKNSIIIKRELIKGSSSVWSVDGEPLSERQTKKLLDEYNIQLDNLCQFLPQDRVSKFSDLKPEELLKEIERSYQDGELLLQHEQLNKLYQEVQLQTKELEEKIEILESLKQKNNELESKAARHKEYLKIQSEIKRTQMVKPFFKLETLMDEKRMAKYNVKNREKEMKLFNDHFKQFYTEVKNVAADTNSNEREIHQLEKQTADFKAIERDLESEIANLEKKITKMLKKVEEHQDHRIKVEEKLSTAKETLETLQTHHDELQIMSEEQYKELNESQAKFSSEQRELSLKRTEISDEVNRQRRQIQKYQVEITNHKKQLASTDRLDQLDNRRYGDLIRALRYLRGNENTFSYFEPPLLTLNVQRDVSFAFDQIIPTHIKNSFVVTNIENFRRLTDVLFDQAKIRVSVRSLTNKSVFEPKVPRDVLAKFGFDGYLVDFVSGPKEVIQMLCENTHLHEIPVSIKGLETKVVEQFQDWNKRNNNVIVKFISGFHIFTSNKSRYGKKQVVLSGDNVQRRPNLFSGGISEEKREMAQSEIDKLNKQIEQSNEKIEASQETELNLNRQYANLKDKSDDIRKQFLEERGKRNKHEKYELKMDDVKEKIRHLEKELRTLDALNNDSTRRSKIIDEISELNKQMVKLVGKYVECTNNRMIKEMGLSELTIKVEQQQLKSKRLKNVESYLKKKNQEFIDQVERLKIIERRANEEYNNFKKEYTSQISQYSPEEKQSMKEYITSLKAKFSGDQNENSADSAAQMELVIEREITKMKSKLDLAGAAGNAEAIELLELNRTRIVELNERISELESLCADCQKRLKSLHDIWKPELDKIVKIVDTDFGANMRIVASGGSVSLDESISDYSKWKLVIKVSFRDAEELTQFNGAQHSGGEKSTTTAVFLNSLQGLTNTPFRIVDEINQGMDSKNERNAHKLIVQRATDPNINASQYFLITPKLLTDLYYSERMSVHCIFAGKWTPMFTNDSSFLELGVSSNYIKSTM